MGRKLFFFIERLQVEPTEVRAIIMGLLLLAGVLHWAPAYLEARTVGWEGDLQEETRFIALTEEARKRHEAWMSRFDPPEESTGEGVQERDEERATHRLDLNRATPVQLEELPGIGPAYARRIVEWREIHGPFIDVGQLIEIRGIGPKRLEALESRVRVVAPDSR